jgi:hypothetical protein
MSNQSLVSVAHLCGQLRYRHKAVTAAVDELGIEPVLTMDDRPYYAEADVSRLIAHLIERDEHVLAYRERLADEIERGGSE